MTNQKLKKALLEKLGITKQGLSNRIQKLKKKISMTTEDATYVIAQQEGLILDKYLAVGALDRVRKLHLDTLPIPEASVSQKKGGKVKQKVERVIKIAQEPNLKDPLLPGRKISEAAEMTKTFLLLYILENSIRETIDQVMTSRYGSDWWESKAPQKLKDRVSTHMSDEQRNMWHQKKGARPIDYLDFIELPKLMNKLQKEFVPDIIPQFQWFDQLVQEVYKSRCVVCHMNPLHQDNVKAVRLRLTHWQKQIQSKVDLIRGVKP